MLKDKAFGEAWEERGPLSEPADFARNMRLLEAMLAYARSLGVLPPPEKLEGLEARIRMARVLNVSNGCWNNSPKALMATDYLARHGDSGSCQRIPESLAMKLPGGDHAVVELAKLRNYCLNEQHPRGWHKAPVFASTLGLTSNDAEMLRDALLRAAREEEATLGGQDDYGKRYMLDFFMTGPASSGMVRSTWIVLAGESSPRLVTCFVR